MVIVKESYRCIYRISGNDQDGTTYTPIWFLGEGFLSEPSKVQMGFQRLSLSIVSVTVGWRSETKREKGGYKVDPIFSFQEEERHIVFKRKVV